MIVGLGTDLVENRRIGMILERHGDRFLRRIFSEDEIEYASGHTDPVPFLAARFATKEAVIKALNITRTSRRHTPGFHEIEVVGRGPGKKRLRLKGNVLEMARSLGADRFHLSMSHTEEWSMAVVILEKLTETKKS